MIFISSNKAFNVDRAQIDQRPKTDPKRYSVFPYLLHAPHMIIRKFLLMCQKVKSIGNKRAYRESVMCIVSNRNPVPSKGSQLFTHLRLRKDKSNKVIHSLSRNSNSSSPAFLTSMTSLSTNMSTPCMASKSLRFPKSRITQRYGDLK